MKAKRSAARRRHHEARLRDRPPAAAAGPTWDEVQAVLDEEIQALPASLRSAFVLCVLEGNSGAQAAAALGVPEGTVWSRLTRARQQLQRRLTHRGIHLAALLAAVSVADSAAAGVSAALTRTAIRSGLLVAAGESAAGVIPSHVAALAAGVTRAMYWTKARTLTAVLLAACLVAGAAALTHRVTAAHEADRPPAGPSAKPAAGGEPRNTVAVSGRVLGPDGEALSGARLYLFSYSLRDREVPVRVRATSAEGGRFRFRVPRPDADFTSDDLGYYVVATADGCAPGLLDYGRLDRPTDGTVRLLRDDVPIRGRILDLQGKPVAGVTVRVNSLYWAGAEGLGPWLAALKANKDDAASTLGMLAGGIQNPELARFFPAVTTGADGRFRLRGVGRERVFGLQLRGPGIALQQVEVMTRAAEPIRALRFKRNPTGPRLNYYGATFDHVAAPTRPIVGVVRDADTGKPLAGITVQSDQFAGVNASGDSSVNTVTDKEGRYRLLGMPKGRGNIIKVVAGEGRPYLQVSRDVSDPPGLDPITVDFNLKRGVLIKGRVFDKVTGKPVYAHVMYHAFLDNPHLKAVPGWTIDYYLQTKEDGSYQVVGFPGRGVISARGWSDRYRMGVGADRIPGKDTQMTNVALFLTAPGLLEATTFHTYVEVKPAKGAESVTCDIALDPGRVPRGKVVGPDGKPLAGTVALGLTGYLGGRNMTQGPPRGGDFTVYGLGPGEGREVVFWHPEKRLAGALVVGGDDRGPFTVKLAPWGTVAGRLLDREGRPRGGVRLVFGGSPAYPNVTLTGKDGRFRVEGLVPGLRYTLQIEENGTVTGRVFDNLALKAGEAKDLGDVRPGRANK